MEYFYGQKFPEGKKIPRRESLHGMFFCTEIPCGEKFHAGKPWSEIHARKTDLAGKQKICFPR